MAQDAPLGVSEVLPVNWGQCCVWRNVKTRALRRRSRRCWPSSTTYSTVQPTAHGRFASRRALFARRHAADEQMQPAHWHLSMCTGTRRMKLQPWRAFKSGTGPSQLAIVVDYFGLVTTACTTHAGDSRGPESSSRGPAQRWRLFVDPHATVSHSLLPCARPAAIVENLATLLHACGPHCLPNDGIESSRVRAASTSAPARRRRSATGITHSWRERPSGAGPEQRPGRDEQ